MDIQRYRKIDRQIYGQIIRQIEGIVGENCSKTDVNKQKLSKIANYFTVYRVLWFALNNIKILGFITKLKELIIF